MVGPHSGLQEVSMFSAEVTLELAVEGRGLPFRAGVKAIQVEGQAPSKAWRTGKRCPVRGSRVPQWLNSGAHVDAAETGLSKEPCLTA